MSYSLNLIVNHVTFFLKDRGVIVGESTYFFFADDGREIGRHDNGIGIHRCHTSIQIRGGYPREKLFP